MRWQWCCAGERKSSRTAVVLHSHNYINMCTVLLSRLHNMTSCRDSCCPISITCDAASPKFFSMFFLHKLDFCATFPYPRPRLTIHRLTLTRFASIHILYFGIPRSAFAEEKAIKLLSMVGHNFRSNAAWRDSLSTQRHIQLPEPVQRTRTTTLNDSNRKCSALREYARLLSRSAPDNLSQYHFVQTTNRFI